MLKVGRQKLVKRANKRSLTNKKTGKKAYRLNAAGQALLEFILISSIFLILVATVIRKIPTTFSQATPFLGGKIEQRLQTGVGFADANNWSLKSKPKGGYGK